MVKFYILTIILIITNLYFDTLLRQYFFLKGVFIENKFQNYLSIICVTIFITFFVLLFRIARIFFSKNSYINVFYFYELFDVYGCNLMFLVIFVIFFLRNLLSAVVRYHFLRLYFIHQEFFFPFFYNFRAKVQKFLKKNTIIYILINYCITVVILISVSHGLFYNKGLIYAGFLPLYAFYRFFFSVLKFFNQFVPEFDFVSFKVYKKLKITFECFYKLKEYHNFLIFGDSEYNFMGSIDLKFKEREKNTLSIEKNVDYFI